MKRIIRREYEYILPNDEMRLAIDAMTYAGIHCIRDGIVADYEQFAPQRAHELLEQLNLSTNNPDSLYSTFIGNYVQMYIEKQRQYRKDITSHEQELKMYRELGEYTFMRYRAYVEKTLSEIGVK